MYVGKTHYIRIMHTFGTPSQVLLDFTDIS